MVFILDLDEYSDIETHWVAFYIRNNNNSVMYFDSFGVEHIPKEIRAFINNKNNNIIKNIFGIKAYYSIMRGYFWIVFIDFMLEEKTLAEYENLFSPNSFKKNDSIILNYFMDNI